MLKNRFANLTEKQKADIASDLETGLRLRSA
jgi:hypothetical protein